MSDIESVRDAEGDPVFPGDVVQIDPAHSTFFGAGLMVVTEVKPWGAVGYVLVPNVDGAERACYRAPSDWMVRVGTAAWVATPDAGGSTVDAEEATR